MKNYEFLFTTNKGVTIATMTLDTPVAVDVYQLGDDLAMSLIHQLGINVNTQVTVDTIDSYKELL